MGIIIPLIIKYSQRQLINVSGLAARHQTSLIITAFDPDQMDGRPEDQVIGAENKGSSTMKLSSDELQLSQQLLSKCYSYCRVSTIVYTAIDVTSV